MLVVLHFVALLLLKLQNNEFVQQLQLLHAGHVENQTLVNVASVVGVASVHIRLFNPFGHKSQLLSVAR